MQSLVLQPQVDAVAQPSHTASPRPAFASAGGSEEIARA